MQRAPRQPSALRRWLQGQEFTDARGKELVAIDGVGARSRRKRALARQRRRARQQNQLTTM
eukprot:11164989-Lingulodinium_polyedra.AAC.1